MPADTQQRKRPYQSPQLEVFGLSAIVMSGATGGGDSGHTGFSDGSTDEERERNRYEEDGDF